MADVVIINTLICTLDTFVVIISRSISLQFRDKLKKLRDLTDNQGRCKKLRERLEQTTLDHIQKTGLVLITPPNVLSGQLSGHQNYNSCKGTVDYFGL